MTEENKGPKAQILEERHMISIMIYLGENDGCKKTELYSAVSNNPRMPDKLDQLESCGLIRQELKEGSRATWIYLTEPSTKISSELRKIEVLMPD